MLTVGVTHGMRGWFAVLYDPQGPIESGYGSYESADAAWVEAREWAAAEGHPLDSAAPEERPSGGRPRYYTGIGSRGTPEDMLALMRRLAARLRDAGWVLRSGAADGADQAFESGADEAKEIWLPWDGFSGRRHDGASYLVASRLPTAAEAERIAAAHHPGWTRLSPAARKLMTRNVHQVLGPHLDSPSSFLVCWAPAPKREDGRVVDVQGGTGLAVRLAHTHRVPVFHLGLADHRERIDRFLAGTAG